MHVKNKLLKTFVVILSTVFLIGALILPTSTTVLGKVTGSYDLDQAANGGVGNPPISPVEWVNGNLNQSKAHYEEGQSVAYRLVIINLEGLPTTTVRIEWDTKKSSTNAIDYITGPQRIAETVDPTDGVSGLGTVSYWPIPTPTAHATRIASFNALPNDDDNKSLWAYNVSNVSFGTYDNGSDTDADSSTYIDITFQPTSETVVLAWGGHIASQADWGEGNSASNISGSPYHMRILHMSNNESIGGGNQDRSLSAAAVIPTNSEISLIKSGTYEDTNSDGIVNVGDHINYTFTVENTGNVTLTNVTVTDPKVTVIGGPVASMDPGDIDNTTFTGSYAITQADINAGQVDNTATATGNNPEDNPVTDTDDETVNLDQNANINIVKSGTYEDTNSDGIVNVGDHINYTFTIENTGNVTLTNVTVTDPKVTVSGGPIASMDPNDVDNTTFTGSYSITQADINAGQVDNTATATGNDPDDNPVTDTDDETVNLGQNANIKIVKSGTYEDTNSDGIVNVGDHINYTFSVENTGNVTLTNVTVTDPKVTVSGGPVASMDPGDIDNTTFAGSYAITQADINAGKVDNTATATGNDPDDNPVTDTDDETVNLGQNANIKIVKSGTYEDTNSDGIVNVGDYINYTFTVQNTGNVTLTDVTVTDPKVTVSGGPVASMNPGDIDNTTFTGSYAITQDDIDAGKVDNTATATGTDPDKISVIDIDNETVNLGQNISIQIIKSGVFNDEDGDGYADIDETITYTFTVTNDGNVTLTNVDVSDPKVTVIGGPLASLAVGASDSTTFSGTYTIDQADITDGYVYNQAEVTCDEGVSDTDDEIVELPVIIIQTTPDTKINLNICPCPLQEHIIYPGDMLTARITETNTGDESLTDPWVWLGRVSPATGSVIESWSMGKDDDQYLSGDTNDNGILDPGETWVWFILYLEVENDVTFVAQGHGWSAGQGEDVTWPAYPNERDSVYVDVVDTQPSLSIIKSGTWVDGDGNGSADVGEVINYTFSVTNEGNVTLNNVTVTDPKVTVNGGPIVLDVGETDDTTFTGTYTITQADIDAGYVDNTATADSDESGPASDDETVELPVIIPQTTPDTKVTLVASAYTVSSGNTVDLTVTEENTGDEPLTNPYVWVGRLDPVTGLVITPGWAMGKNDPHYVSGDTNNDSILDPGETWTWEIPDVEIVGDGVFIIAKGHGWSGGLEEDIAWPEYPNERDTIFVDTIKTQAAPDTQLCLNVTYPGDTLTMTITETNSGDVPINNPYVWVGGIDPATGLVIDINIDDTASNGWAMGKDDDQYVSGDANDNDILDPGEIWVWAVIGIEVNEDMVVVAKGHGSVSGMEGDIAYPDYPNERDTEYVEVI